MIFAVSILIIGYNFYHSSQLRVMVALILTTYWMTMPVLKWGKKDSPFIVFLKFLQDIHNKKKDIEIYRILIQLKKCCRNTARKALQCRLYHQPAY